MSPGTRVVAISLDRGGVVSRTERRPPILHLSLIRDARCGNLSFTLPLSTEPLDLH